MVTATLTLGSLADRPRPVVPGRRRIVAAMSGGVDSAVAAALLKAEGHEVIGITLQLYDHGEATKRRGSCCAGQDIHDARRVADHLGIAHYVLDYEKRFEAAVMQSFADSYLAGETPIPCVACNAKVKFKDLLDTALELGADYMATGHYIARRETAAGPQLVRAADTSRDQSYFLFSTTRAQLDKLCFPLGDLQKDEVREIAARLKLPVAEKPDSQDICFVPSGRYTDVITRLRPDQAAEGEIVHVDGRVLGRHTGIANFTIGQRRGLNVSSAEPLFVVRLEPATQRVIAGPREHLRTTALAIKDINWLGEGDFGSVPASVDIYVKLRSQHAPQPACVHFLGGGRAIVELAGAEYGISAGQACVFYTDGSERSPVLGGGWIERGGAPAAATRSAGTRPPVSVEAGGNAS
jgi:tRNA-uridine 2-sulfurtransferase